MMDKKFLVDRLIEEGVLGDFVLTKYIIKEGRSKNADINLYDISDIIQIRVGVLDPLILIKKGAILREKKDADSFDIRVVRLSSEIQRLVSTNPTRDKLTHYLRLALQLQEESNRVFFNQSLHLKNIIEVLSTFLKGGGK